MRVRQARAFAIALLEIASSSAASAEGLAYRDRLVPPERNAGAEFGAAVDVDADGRTVAVGAPQDAQYRGGAYVYRNLGHGWFLESELRTAAVSGSAKLGSAVALHGDLALVGAEADRTPTYPSGSAVVFRRGAEGWSAEQKLTGPSGRFGAAAAIAGDHLIVGAPRSSVSTLTQSGVVTVFARDEQGVWTETQRFWPIDPRPFAGFGSALAVDGDTLVVGSPLRGSRPLFFAGGVFVYRREDGHWREVQQLWPSDPAAYAHFGRAVAVRGDTILVGAPYSPGAVRDPGAVYVFRRIAGRWTETRKVVPIDGDYNEHFGFSVALHGQRAVVGTDFKNRVYLLRIGEEGWEVDRRLTVPELRTTPIGQALAIAEGVVVAGVPLDSGAGFRTGSTWLFQDRHGGADNRPPEAVADRFATVECDTHQGGRVSLDGSASWDLDSSPGTNDDIVFFDWFRDFAGPGQAFLGAAEVLDTALLPGRHGLTLRVTDRGGLQDLDTTERHVVDTARPAGGITYPEPDACLGSAHSPVVPEDDFADDCDPDLERTYGAPWGERTKLLAADAEENDRFGASVALPGDRIAVGALFDKEEPDRSGAVYVLERGDSTWGQAAKIPSPDGGGYSFGRPLVAEGEDLLVGSIGDRTWGPSSGAVHVYRPTDDGWRRVQRLDPGQPASYSQFGASIAVDGDSLAIGMRGDSAAGYRAGAVWTYRRDDDGTWVREATLSVSDICCQIQFGHSVALDGDTLAVSTVRGDTVYVYRRSSAGWALQSRIESPDAADWIDARVALDEDFLAVGARWDRWREIPWIVSGTVHVFRRDGDVWSQEAVLEQPWPRQGVAWFGDEVVLRGTSLLVGANGAAYLYERDDGQWSLRQELDAGIPSLRFGDALAMDGTRIVAGDSTDGEAGSFAGAAYVYGRCLDGRADRHGEHCLVVTARDDTGYSAQDSVRFTLDLVPPEVRLLKPPGGSLVPTLVPFELIFDSHDDDGAPGDVLHERVLLDGCLLYDGAAYGDRDGLLRDEALTMGLDTLCEAARRCGWTSLDRPEVSVEAVDCGDNVGLASHRLPASLALRPGVCTAF